LRQQDISRGYTLHTHNIDRLVIRQTNKSTSNARLEFGHNSFPCLIGKNGVGTLHREGNGMTPRGLWNISYVLYREDRIKSLQTALPTFKIKPNDSWCDNQTKRSYNKPLGYIVEGSDENLYRNDSLYDIIFVINQNKCPVIPGLGSAIFLHVSEKNRDFTAGCIAVSNQNIKKILRRCSAKTKIKIL